MRYIALLRGVNVGGKNMLSMPALRAALEALGFAQVRTYINSGNLLFTSDVLDVGALKARIEACLREAFAIDTPVMVISASDLIEAMNHAPAWWNRGEQAKHNAVFIIPPMTAEEALRTVGALKPEYEQVASHGRVIFWSAPIQTFSRTKWSKVVGTPLYDFITIRNANTAGKLLDLARMP